MVIICFVSFHATISFSGDSSVLGYLQARSHYDSPNYKDAPVRGRGIALTSETKKAGFGVQVSSEQKTGLSLKVLSCKDFIEGCSN